MVVEVRQIENRENHIFWCGFGFHQDFCTGIVLGFGHKSGPLSQLRELGDGPRLMADPEYISLDISLLYFSSEEKPI